MATPDWATVLATLYQDPSEEVGYDIDKHHSFVTETDLGVEEAESAVDKLREWQIIKLESKQIDDPDEEGSHDVIHIIELTEKGFNVAHDRELANRNNRINAALVVFTFFLVIVNVLDSVPFGPTNRFLISLGVLVLLLILIFRTEILDFDVFE